ncbi:RICIN domain-containing protein [Streptomyces sp. NPDC002623]
MVNMEARARASIKRHFVRRATTALLALAVSMGFLFLNAGSASAINSGDVIGKNFLRSWQTGRCLDSNSNGDVYTLPCQQGNQYQTWEIKYQGHDTWDIVSIKNSATGLCLATHPDYGFLATSCSTAYIYWYGMGSGWDNVQLARASWPHGGYCLDSDYAGDAYATPCGDNDYQHWKLGY